jgi:hypothetical protein
MLRNSTIVFMIMRSHGKFVPVDSLRLLLCFLFVLIVSGGLFAQKQPPLNPPGKKGSRIIDDTTRQIYGPNTSRYYFEQDVFYNRQVYYSIDTLIRNFHRYTYVQRFNYLYQDLGNVGTAIRPIFYQTPDVIGRRSGSHVYDLYWDTEPVRYYDTKSPYSNMKVILGGGGRSITRATFSRNITPQWNFGFTYRGLFIDKNIQRTGKADRLTRSNYYDAYTAYQSKDSSYRAFVNFRRNFHRVEEFGGVRSVTDIPLRYDQYFEDNVQPWLTNAESNDLRMNVHLFHQYSFGKGLQVYHRADRYRQKNNYLDYQDGSTDDFYDVNTFDRDSTRDVAKFKAVRNEAGIKGNLGKLFFNGYYAIRHYSMHYNRFMPDSLIHPTFDSLRVPIKGNEHYLGGRMSLHLDSIGTVTGGIEVEREGNYKIEGQIVSRWFEARATQMRYAPGFFEQAYRGAHDVWNNSFSNINSTQFTGALHYRSSSIEISPGLTFTNLDNYVFYKKVSDVDTVQQVLPVQSSGKQTIFSPELKISLKLFKHILIGGDAIYTKLLENSDDAISVPELMVNGQLAYANIFFNGNFDFHAGVDVHWQSAYPAPGYDPAIRQFYIQNEFIVPAAPIVDIFVNVKIKRGRVFFRYHNLMQAFTGEGYMPTPYYPGIPNTIDFGFDWSFYD